jgi:glycosyl hydrolase family 26
MRSRRVATLISAGLAAVLVACGADGGLPSAPAAEPGGGSGGAGGSGGSGGSVVRGSFLGGVFLGDANTTPENVTAAIAEYASMSGKKPALVKTFHYLEADLSPTGWAGRILRAIAGSSATNFVALDLDWPGRATGSLLDAILRGDADTRIDRAAHSLSQVNGIVLVEPAWEMNGNWNYAWQGVANGSSTAAPAKYVTAWHRVVDRFRAAGVTNVRWVFNPNTGNPVGGSAAGSSHWNWYGHYYPGDAYVDFVGAHGYNGPTLWKTPFHSFDDLFNGADADFMLKDMKQRYPNKPIILGEIGAEETAGRDKGEWVRQAYEQMLRDPQVVGAVWFNMNKEADWRINSSAGSLAAYRTAMENGVVSDHYDDNVLSRAALIASK